MKTHRCKQLLDANQNSKNGKKIRIRYGEQYEHVYKIAPNEAWWLECVEWDSEWDVDYLSTICKIDFCPKCGEKLCF